MDSPNKFESSLACSRFETDKFKQSIHLGVCNNFNTIDFKLNLINQTEVSEDFDSSESSKQLVANSKKE